MPRYKPRYYAVKLWRPGKTFGCWEPRTITVFDRMEDRDNYVKLTRPMLPDGYDLFPYYPADPKTGVIGRVKRWEKKYRPLRDRETILVGKPGSPLSYIDG